MIDWNIRFDPEWKIRIGVWSTELEELMILKPGVNVWIALILITIVNMAGEIHKIGLTNRM